ncbi:MAG: hypothetical protein R3C17_08660 [Planctomycetaceae bacterium]
MIAVIGGASLISGSTEPIKASTGAPLRFIRKEKCGNALLYVYANSDFVLLNWQTTNGNSPYQVVSAKLINLSSNLEVEAPCSQRYRSVFGFKRFIGLEFDVRGGRQPARNADGIFVRIGDGDGISASVTIPLSKE